jgi:hypothetical protein
MTKRLWSQGLVAVAVALFVAACGGGGGVTQYMDTGDGGIAGADADIPGDVLVPPDGDLFDIPSEGIHKPDDAFETWETGPDGDLGVLDGDAGVDADGQSLCEEEGAFGCPCTANEECASGWCVETPDGYVCSMVCTEECPLGWYCAMVQDFPDVVHACLPVHPKLCRPCAKDQECQGIVIGTTSLCLDLGETGAYCGGDCSENGNPCPAGYTCKNSLSIEGGEALQCVPESGECDCSPLAIELELSTVCYVSNQYGKCLGERVCGKDGLSDCDAETPAPEICNAKDDNCNGVADDNLIQEECKVENQFGACPGTVLCVGGQPVCQGNTPTAETCDGLDNDCDGTPDDGYSDCDGDGIADCIEPDDDADGLLDSVDNCPCAPNATQANADGDGLGDACDPDDDNDLTLDDQDCQPTNPKVFPGAIETCNGLDDDCDNTLDEGFVDSDQDLQADCVDADDDNDALADMQDNCPTVANPDQKDTDFDKQGDLCDPDDDGDGYPDETDCGPTDKNVYPNAPELCDCKDNNCNGKTDENYTDTDKDGVADCCEDDTDGDGVPNGLDNCPYADNTDQLNTDGDLQGDECDSDDDNDGVIDAVDCAPKEVKAFPNAPEVCDGVDNDCDGGIDNKFPDTDKDGLADCIDPDDDGDGIADPKDNCVFLPNALQTDTDKDGFGDACDWDDDGDGDGDLTDCQPLNPLVNHSTVEVCNGSDDNCDGIADNPGATGCIQLFGDGDGDGFGLSEESLCLCVPEEPYVAFQGGDCNDADPKINPVAAEVCNGTDDNCDGKSDPAGASGCTKYYQDADGDGVGVTGVTQCLCKAAPPYSSTKTGDCAPSDPAVFPGNIEVCDGKDNDCDGNSDNVDAQNCTKFYKDGDKDGYGLDASSICACQGNPAQGFTATQPGDCNDSDATVNPGVPEKCGDMVDNNCSGKKEENCSPKDLACLFVSAGGKGKGTGKLSATFGLGMFAGSGKLANVKGFTAKIGLLPTSVY